MIPIILTMATDVREVMNAWKEDYNLALSLLDSGDARQALEVALRALEGAHPSAKNRVRIVVADAASQTGDHRTEFDVLNVMLEDPSIAWGLFWNGAIDAHSHPDYPATAFRFALEAHTRNPEKRSTAPLLLDTALLVDQIDTAAMASEHIARGEKPVAKSRIVRGMIAQHRCLEAQRFYEAHLAGLEGTEALGRGAEECR